MTRLERIVLALRVVMEIGVVAAFAYWGVHSGATTAGRILLGFAAPALGFGFWGAIDFRGAGRFAEPLRLMQELAVSSLAGLAWYSSGRPVAGAALVGVSVAYHTAVYATGQRLLEPRPQERSM